MKTSPALFAALSLLALAPAQEKAAPFRFVPADAQIVLRLGAPARWQQQFAGTKAAKLFASDTLKPYVAQATAAIDAGLERMRARGKVDVDLVEKLLREYRGELVVALHLDPDGLGDAMASGEPPAFGVSVALVPDGSFDLAAFTASVAKSAETDGDELRDVTIGEHRLRAQSLDDGVQATVPVMVDGHMVMLLGNDLEKSGARLLGAADRRAVPAGEQPLSLHVDGRGMLGAMRSMFAEQTESGAVPFDLAGMFDATGLFALESLQMSVEPAGERVQMDFTLQTANENRGFLDVFAGGSEATKLLRYLPAGADAFSVMAFDLGALYRVVEGVWSGMGEFAPITFEDAIAAAAEQLKVRPKEDLIDHLGNGLLQVVDSAALAEADIDDPMAGFAGCFVLPLRDGKAFGESLEKALRARGMHAARKTEEYEGAKVHRLRVAGMIELEYAVTDDLLLLALGAETSRQQLRGVLDARRQGGSDKLPASVQPYVDALPKGWNGLSATQFASTLNAMSRAFTMLEERGGFDEEEEGAEDGAENRAMLTMIRDLTAKLGGELERLGLGLMVGATYTDPNRIAGRLLW